MMDEEQTAALSDVKSALAYGGDLSGDELATYLAGWLAEDRRARAAAIVSVNRLDVEIGAVDRISPPSPVERFETGTDQR